jgi:hypothetical protein
LSILRIFGFVLCFFDCWLPIPTAIVRKIYPSCATLASFAPIQNLFQKPKRADWKVGQAFQPDSGRSGPGPTTAGVWLESLTYDEPAWISSLWEQTLNDMTSQRPRSRYQQTLPILRSFGFVRADSEMFSGKDHADSCRMGATHQIETLYGGLHPPYNLQTRSAGSLLKRRVPLRCRHHDRQTQLILPRFGFVCHLLAMAGLIPGCHLRSWDS